MRWFLSSLCVLCLNLPAVAQELPALFDVIGVESDDVLNIRTSPTSGAGILGEFGPVQRDIEVLQLSDNGKWGLVNIGESTGWTFMRYLIRQPGDGLMDGNLTCFGTEPFWDLSVSNGANAVFTSMEGNHLTFHLDEMIPAAGYSNRVAFVGRSPSKEQMSATAHRTICSDGMSDRQYGLEIDLLLREASGLRYLTGCCSLIHR